MPDYVKIQTIRVVKKINAPIRFVYNWCTDFRDDDSRITGSKKNRRILFKTKRRVIYYQYFTDSDGSQKIIVNLVTLKPPNSWHLEYFGEEDDEIGNYRLKAIGNNKTKLEMIFKEQWKVKTDIPTIREQEKQTSEFWDKFISALMEDFRASKGVVKN